MPGLYKDEAIVLRSIRLGEADRILTIFCREHGKVRAVAKGIRKTKSRFGGRLESFNRVSVMLYKGRGDLDTITGADVVEALPALRHDYLRLASAAAIAEVVEKISPDREGSHPTYSLLASGLQALARDGASSIVPAFVLKLLSISGYHPHLRACAGCGRTGVLGGFSSSLGGAVCETCWHLDQEAVGMATGRIELMARLLAEDFGHPAPEAEVEALTDALRSYAEYHIDRPLRSFQMLRPIRA